LQISYGHGGAKTFFKIIVEKSEVVVLERSLKNEFLFNNEFLFKNEFYRKNDEQPYPLRAQLKRFWQYMQYLSTI
jgi:hypothetical protein